MHYESNCFNKIFFFKLTHFFYFTGDADMPALVDGDMELEDEEEEGTGWDDDDDVGDGNEDLLLGPVKCLFCEKILQSAEEVFSHCGCDHAFSVHAFCGVWSLDCIGYIKMINFMRSQVNSCNFIGESMNCYRHNTLKTLSVILLDLNFL